MATVTELFANPPTPGGTSPWVLTTLASPVDTAPAQGTIEEWDVASAAPAALCSAPPAQFRIVVDSEIIIVTASATGASPWTVERGAEGSTPATHASGQPLYHVLTAGALANISSDLAVDRAFVQSTPPEPAAGFGEYIWFVTDGSGDLLDIQSGIA